MRGAAGVRLLRLDQAQEGVLGSSASIMPTAEREHLVKTWFVFSAFCMAVAFYKFYEDWSLGGPLYFGVVVMATVLRQGGARACKARSSSCCRRRR